MALQLDNDRKHLLEFLLTERQQTARRNGKIMLQRLIRSQKRAMKMQRSKTGPAAEVCLIHFSV